ncbi:hypothetical protein BH09PSE6_BH09PSE6_34240 [soil metagenome]
MPVKHQLCAVLCCIAACTASAVEVPVDQAAPVQQAKPLVADPVQASTDAYDKGTEAYVANDFVEARKQWSRVVAAGNRDADNNLGYLFYYGLGGARDYPRALHLWRRAAVAGQPESQMHLGDAFKNGVAVPKDLVQAYAWFRFSMATAAKPGPGREDLYASIAGQARDALAKLAPTMTRAQVASGELLGAQYIAALTAPGPGPLDKVRLLK